MRRAALLPVLLGAWILATAGCDLSVTNPGPVQEPNLDRPEARAAIVNGMARTLSKALTWIAYTGGIVGLEIRPADGLNVSDFGISLRQRQGVLDPDPGETDEHWQFAQQARWTAEDGVRRLRETLGADFAASALAGKALLYAGYANRLLGENMCQAVIDGGPAQPRRVSLERAEAAFTEAIAVAGAAGDLGTVNAALAGRASVRAWLGDWAGVVTDAEAVPPGLVVELQYSEIELDQYNRAYFANASQPYRNHTVFGTFYDDYFRDTGDPRTPWGSNPQFPVSNLTGEPWHFQLKHARRDAPIRLSSYREMRLLVAEARLRSGNPEEALEILNELRAATGVGPWRAEGAVEVWTALKRERGIELWLEGRRLGDLYRWLQEGTPGQVEDMTGRSTCFPIGRTEIDTNPNL